MSGVVCESQAEFLVDLGLAGRLSPAEDVHQAAQVSKGGGELVAVESPPLRDGQVPELVFQSGLAFLLFTHPTGDQCCVGTRFQSRAMAGELSITLGHLTADVLGFGDLGSWCLFHFAEQIQGSVDVGRAEQALQPTIKPRRDVDLTEIDVPGVFDPVRQGVLLRVAAAVVLRLVDPLPLHVAVTQTTDEQATELVDVAGPQDCLVGVAISSTGHGQLDCFEVLTAHDRRMRRLVRPDPVALRVPAEFGHVAQADVIDVDEHLVFALPVPDLVARVPGIGQDGAHGTLGPGDARAVTVPRAVMRRRAQDAIPGQTLSNGEQPIPRQVVGEDPGDDDRGDRVELQPVKSPAIGRLGRIRVRSRVNEDVAVGRTAAQEPALHLCLGAHGTADADLHPVTLPFAHPAEDAHDEVVRLVRRVDGAAHLGHPQGHAEVLEDREGQAILVAVEGPMRLTDDHRLEAAIAVPQGRQERRRAGTTLPGDRARLVDVEELGDDPAPARLDEGAGAGDLPGSGRCWILVVLCGHAAVEAEPDLTHDRLSGRVQLRGLGCVDGVHQDRQQLDRRLRGQVGNLARQVDGQFLFHAARPSIAERS
nr:hypothetical protein [Herbidospora sp. NBRC 101105]